MKSTTRTENDVKDDAIRWQTLRRISQLRKPSKLQTISSVIKISNIPTDWVRSPDSYVYPINNCRILNQNWISWLKSVEDQSRSVIHRGPIRTSFTANVFGHPALVLKWESSQIFNKFYHIISHCLLFEQQVLSSGWGPQILLNFTSRLRAPSVGRPMFPIERCFLVSTPIPVHVLNYQVNELCHMSNESWTGVFVLSGLKPISLEQ